MIEMNKKKTNKMKNKLRVLVVFCMVGASLSAQTIMKNIPIIADDPFLIKTWAYNYEIEKFGWYEITEVNQNGIGWYIEKEIRCKVDRYDVLDVLFIRGFDDCADTTRLKIYGSFEKEIVKDKENLRKFVRINGGSYSFGREIERPK